MKKIGIIGAGKWGQALAFAFSQKNEVYITSRTPRDLKNFVSLEEVLELEYLVIAIPAQEVSGWLDKNFVNKNQKILVVAKGIESSSGRFLNEIYALHVKEENLAFLSGPSFAVEVQQSLPTALVVNSTSRKTAEEFSRYFPDFMRIYLSSDVTGAEIAGAYKNVIAIASGICEGMGLGKNAAATLISRGLIEMQRFGEFYGAKAESFMGLSGAGDLFLTASSPMSRNFRVGLALAQNKSLDVIIEELGEVAEGVGTTYALHKISQEKGIYLPIASEMYKILEGKSIKQSISDLLTH